MSAVVLTAELILVLILTLFLLHQYGNWRAQHPIVTVAVLIACYFSFLIVFIIPMDVSSTLYQQCLKNAWVNASSTFSENGTQTSFAEWNISSHSELVDGIEQNDTRGLFPSIVDDCEAPWSYIPPLVLPVLWRVLYWTCQILTWLLLPLMQSYAMAGDFHVGGKLLTSLKRNAIYYGTYLLVFGVLLIYVATRPEIHLDSSKLYTLIVTASNTWGLFLMILLLGYGLVEIPRRCWRASNLSYQLAYTQFKLVKVAAEKAEADEEVEDVLEDISKASQQIDQKSSLRQYVDLIISKCPEDFRRKLALPPRPGKASRSSSSDFAPTEKSLVALHKRLISSIHHQFRTSSSWYALLDEGFELEDCIRNKQNAEHTYKSTFPVSHSRIYSAICSPTTEWYWKCVARQWVYKGVAVLLIIFSILVVWSECTFFVEKPVLSVFAKFVELAGRHKEYFNVELASFCVIAFLSLCTYFTVFRLRVFNYYVLAPRHQTDENSLIFVATMLCRLTPPMCLNFLGVIHMDSHIIKERMDETAYTRIMGHLDVLPLISDGFNVYFPLFIVVICLATYFRVGSRLLNFCGFQQFLSDDDEIGVDFVSEGRELMQRERRRRLRAEESKSRRDQLMELVNNTSNFGHGGGFSTRDTILSRLKNREGASSANSRVRYKNFRNDETTTTQDFPPGPQLVVSGETMGDNSGFGVQPAERSYQSVADSGVDNLVQYRTPPRNLFDDV